MVLVCFSVGSMPRRSRYCRKPRSSPRFWPGLSLSGTVVFDLGQWGNAIPVLRTAFRLAPEVSQTR